MTPVKPAESEVARKQVAHAIGRLLGQGESVYTLLSQDPMTRDTTVARLLQERQRSLPAAAADRTLRVALKAYTTGDYRACLRALHRVAHALTPPEAAGEDQAHALCRRFLEDLGTTTTFAPPVEAVLLAFCALNGLKPASPGPFSP